MKENYKMIIGIGTDLCDIRRIEKTLQKFQYRFMTRIFLENEIKKANSKVNPANSFAKFFAAKEACSKAIGTGIKQGVFWKNFEVKNLSTGQPFINLTGQASKKLSSLTPSNMVSKISLTLTDEYPLAHAMVVISAVPSSNRNVDNLSCQ